MRHRYIFRKYKRLMDSAAEIVVAFPLGCRRLALYACRNIGGYMGLGLRYILLKSLASKCGDNVAVFQGVYIINPENICVGNNVAINPMTYILCGNGKQGQVTIGNDVAIAHGVTILSTTKDYKEPGIINDASIIQSPVHIGNNVWIGAKATVMKGVRIGDGCVIGAGAVVTKDTEPRGVYAGVPARKIGTR